MQNFLPFDQQNRLIVTTCILNSHWQVCKGWEKGVLSMKIGGKCKLITPPQLGYGENGAGAIPPNAESIFDVELLGVR